MMAVRIQALEKQTVTQSCIKAKQNKIKQNKNLQYYDVSHTAISHFQLTHFDAQLNTETVPVAKINQPFFNKNSLVPDASLT